MGTPKGITSHVSNMVYLNDLLTKHFPSRRHLSDLTIIAIESPSMLTRKEIFELAEMLDECILEGEDHFIIQGIKDYIKDRL